MIATADPHVFIEEQRSGYVRYQRTSDGRRWEVHGTCDRRGDCLIGAVIDGFGVIESRADLARAKQQLGRERIDSDCDVPITPEFDSCCSFSYVELPPGE